MKQFERERLLRHQLLLRHLGQWLARHLIPPRLRTQLGRRLTLLVEQEGVDEGVEAVAPQLLPPSAGQHEVGRIQLLQWVVRRGDEPHHAEPHFDMRGVASTERRLLPLAL